MEGEKAIVVADNLCFGSRFYSDQVEEEAIPYLSFPDDTWDTTIVPACTAIIGGDSTYSHKK